MSKQKDWGFTILLALGVVFIIVFTSALTCAFLTESFNYNQINCIEDNYSAKIYLGNKVITIDHVSELHRGIFTYKITDGSTGKVHNVDRKNVDLIKNGEGE